MGVFEGRAIKLLFFFQFFLSVSQFKKIVTNLWKKISSRNKIAIFFKFLIIDLMLKFLYAAEEDIK